MSNEVVLEQYILTVPSVEANGSHEYHPFALPAGADENFVMLYARGILYTLDWTQVDHLIHKVLSNGTHRLVGSYNRHGQKVEVGHE